MKNRIARIRVVGIGFVLAALFANTAHAGPRAYVTNALDGTVSAVDLRSGVVLATIPVGCDPRDIVAHPDGSRVYVANTCYDDQDAGPSTISVIDTRTNSVVDEIPVAWGPVALAIDRSGHRLFAACLTELPFSDEDSSGTLYIIDLATGNRDYLPLYVVPRDLVITPDGRRAFVAMVSGYRDDEGNVVHTSRGVIDIPLDGVGENRTFSGLSGPLAIDSRAGRLYAVDQEQDELAVIDTVSGATLARVPVGVAAQEVFVDRALRRVFVSSAGESPNAPPDAVTVVATTTNRIVDVFDGGWTPVGITRLPRSRTLLVTNFYEGSLLELDVQTGAVQRTIAVGRGAPAVAVVAPCAAAALRPGPRQLVRAARAARQRRIKALVEESCASAGSLSPSSSGMIRCARTLPSSTPH